MDRRSRHLAPADGMTRLSIVLKQSTRTLHDLTEQRFHTLAAFHEAGRLPILTSLNLRLLAWLDPQTRLRLPRGVGQIWQAHAGALREDAGMPDPLVATRFRLHGISEVIGAIYVACGATLGVAVLTRDHRRHGEPGEAGTDSRQGSTEERFLATARLTARRWRNLRGAIDLWGRTPGAHPDACIAGAATAFCAAMTILGTLDHEIGASAGDPASRKPEQEA